ncbi:MAG: LPS export ABC transporter permease LptG [Pseudomonadales bacterium]
MRILDWYTARTVAIMMLMATLGLLGVLALFTFLEQLEDVDENYTLFHAALFVLYSLPRMFYGLIPYSALIGCLSGLGLLANNSELIVMRTSGMSTWSISWSAIKPALVLVVLGLWVGEYILPEAERQARNDRERAISDRSEITPEFGYWYREGNVYMHFDEVGRSGVLGGVSHYYFDGNGNMTRTLYAERAVYHDVREDETYWLLENVIATDLGEERTEVSEFTSLRWDTVLSPGVLSTEILVEPDMMSISELRAKIEYMRKQGLKSDDFELGYWGKVLQPLATIGLVFVAISFVFGPLREASMGTRVLTGLLIGIVFKFAQNLLSPASIVYGFNPLIAILAPIALCFAVGYWLLRRAG